MSIKVLSEHPCYGGVQGFYEHNSTEITLPMRFGVYSPPQARTRRVPALYYLAGLTCNEETFSIKAGAQRLASAHGLMLVTPDTSPRQTGVQSADANWDFGTAAGFYLDATQEPWKTHWRMESYVTSELRHLVAEQFPAQFDQSGLFGHSMGGHGALTLALRNPGLYASVSAFAPIAAPMQCPWGRKALEGYLGGDLSHWKQHDAVELIRMGARAPNLLVDQGLDDQFLALQLHPHLLEQACKEAGQPLTLRRHEGYGHGYYFIQSFIADHFAHHASVLNGVTPN